MASALFLATGRATAPALGVGQGPVLGNGFTVADGSRLVGAVFPGRMGFSFQADLPHEHWEALLSVDGDPARVFDDYLQQAAAAGFDVLGSCALIYPKNEVALTEAPVDTRRLRGIRCRGDGTRAVGDGAETVHISVRRTLATRRASYDSHAVVALERWSGAPPPFVTLRFGETSIPHEGKVGPPVPKARPLPTVGDRLWTTSATEAEPGPQYKVVRGTRALTPPADDDCNYGSSNVLEVTGDVDAVLDRYRRVAEARHLMIETGAGDFRGESLRVLRGTSDGGDQFAALALDQDGDRPALLHLWYCGD